MIWIIAGIIGLVCAYAYYLRNYESKTEKYQKTQPTHENKDAKTGKPKTGIEKLKEKISLSFILWIITGVLLLGLFDVWKNPTIEEIAVFSSSRWFWIFSISAVLFVILNKTADELKEIKGPLQSVLIGILFILFVVAPMKGCLTPQPMVAQQSIASTTPTQALPRNAPNIVWAWQTDKSKWPLTEVPPHGDSIHVPGIYGGHVFWGGAGFTVKCVYSDGHIGIVGDADNPCNDGDIIESYVTNSGDTKLLVRYAYAHQGEK